MLLSEENYDRILSSYRNSDYSLGEVDGFAEYLFGEGGKSRLINPDVAASDGTNFGSSGIYLFFIYGNQEEAYGNLASSLEFIVSDGLTIDYYPFVKEMPYL